MDSYRILEAQYITYWALFLINGYGPNFVTQRNGFYQKRKKKKKSDQPKGTFS